MKQVKDWIIWAAGQTKRNRVKRELNDTLLDLRIVVKMKNQNVAIMLLGRYPHKRYLISAHKGVEEFNKLAAQYATAIVRVIEQKLAKSTQ